MMYEGVKHKILESPIKDEIYRGAHMTKIEIEKIHDCLKNKKNKYLLEFYFVGHFYHFLVLKVKQLSLLLKINIMIKIQ